MTKPTGPDCKQEDAAEGHETPDKPEAESDAAMRRRLVASLSHSFPGSALTRAMKGDVTDLLDDTTSESSSLADGPLSKSCFAQLKMVEDVDEEDEEEEEDEEDEGVDEELTSLSWLQDSDLLQKTPAGQTLLMSPQVAADTNRKEPGGRPLAQGIPYNPKKHINTKPPYSFSCLIFMAIEDHPQKRLPVKDIYNWIVTNFPYFAHAPIGWKNSVRHNLSLNKCFRKVDRVRGGSVGKGSLWCIDPEYRANLLQALRKTPYHPYHQLQMVSPSSFNLHNQLKNEPIDIDVANTLLSLKSNFRSRSPSPPEFGSERERKQTRRRRLKDVIITEIPSEDHSYATQHTMSPATSIDDQYDFGRRTSTSSSCTMETDDEERVKEGADALLHLAGLKPISP